MFLGGGSRPHSQRSGEILADVNTVPLIVDAVKAYATMGQIMAVFEGRDGNYRESLGVA